MSAPDTPAVPTQDERTMALLAHVLQMVGGFLPALIIFFIRDKSRFVRFHAVQVLLYQAAYLLFMVLFIIVWIGSIVGLAATQAQSHGQPPAWFFLLFPLIWIGFFLAWITTLVLSIMYGVKASRGEWAAYPVVGGWARRMLHL
ncbi:MAG TPA: DUF4870 domain-containing protein [Terriglobales bacterium]|nr:DUF4870 domain-containing protein [Terriglobales bacterium]